MIYILIPSFNEAANLQGLVKNISTFLKGNNKIYLIDDGSSDNTKEITRTLKNKFPIIRIGYDNNRGAGYAFKYGFNFVIPKLKNKDIVVTMEADNTTDYKILNSLITIAKTGKVALASPHAQGGSFIGVTGYRIFLSRVASILDSLIFRIKGVKTYSSFYRVYPANILIDLKKHYKNEFISHDGFPSVVELLIRINKLGYQFIEIASKVDWTKRKGSSKMHLINSIKNHLKLYFEFARGQLE
ncbi:MAG: Glycosyl transferase family 2 [Candidatus Curtissbacteria bacterium GW2011_GWA1_40_9]|uniref:Glycosyl transferase family 2 n=1 Tax=Candidatus Curtissbacteria bacterium GW2011_GWA1_40_9 TaxID=1618408 RepID=A0A0G0TMN3_9BACT|nr:MAG: Glycosyl transferase family 2 [Candidatus Curtissbacteria bacterium GW2011_GWA1_40_9]